MSSIKEKMAMSRTKSIRFDVTLINFIEQKAKEDHRSFNNLVETILLKWAQEQKSHGTKVS